MSTNGSAYVVVQTSTGSRAEADTIATSLVEERLAACVQVTPGQSVYCWQGAVERADEFFLAIKTSAAMADKVVEAIGRLHSYDCPEAVVLEVQGGSPAYLAWLSEQVRQE
ncbi:MAG: divalent-cation tolerance protein CutA [Planctomycetota bacterium]